MPSTTSTNPRSQRLENFRKAARPRRNTADAHSDNVPQMSEHQCCGVVEEVAFQVREKRGSGTTPQPWIIRKFMVFFTLGIMGYTGYVYIGRFCVSAIERTDQSTTGRPTASEFSS
jgi:palmitoyltransferase